jgi:uncharacterized protein
MTHRDTSHAWTAIGAWLARRTGVVLAIAAVVTVALAPGVAQLEFATGQDSYLDRDSQIAVDNRSYQGLFGGETVIVLLTAQEGHEVGELMAPENVARLAAIPAALEGRAEVFTTITPDMAITWSSDLVTSGTATAALAGAAARDPDPDGQIARQTDLALTAARLGAAGEPVLDNPAWVDFLLYDNTGFSLVDGEVVEPDPAARVVRASLRGFVPDGRHALVAVVLAGNATLDEQSRGTDLVVDATRDLRIDGFDVVTTGVPLYLSELNDYLQGGMLTLGAIAVAVMVVVLLVLFGVRWRLLPLATTLLGVLWAFGLFGYLGIALSLVTIAGLPILIGMGIDVAIQVHSRVEGELQGAVSGDLAGGGDAVPTTARVLGPPVVVAVLAAVVAFLSMQVSRVPMIRDFGVMLAIGITTISIVGVVLPLALLGWRERRRPGRARAGEVGWIERTILRVGALPQATALPLAACALVAVVAGLAVEGRSEIDSDPINWVDQQGDAVRDARTLERETGFATTLGVAVRSPDVLSDDVAAFTYDLVRDRLAAEPDLVAVSSLATTVGFALDVPGASPVPPTGADLLAALEVAPPGIARALVSPDRTAAQIDLRVGPASLAERAGLVDRLRAAIDPPPGVSAFPAGLATVGVGLLQDLEANRGLLTAVALTAVAAWLVLRLRSAVRALLALVPVLLAVGLSSVVVWALGITLSPLTTVGGPLVVATCAEFCVLILARYVEERERGDDPPAAVRRAASRTGRAFVTSGCTTVGGFAVLGFSALPLLSDFGLVVTLNVTVALVSALVGLPPVLVWADQRGWVVPTATVAATVAAPVGAAVDEVGAVGGAPAAVATGDGAPAPTARAQLLGVGVPVVLLLVLLFTLLAVADEGSADATAEPVAPTPAPTTVVEPTQPSTTTTAVATTTVPGAPPAEGATTTTGVPLPTPVTDGGSERPAGLVGGGVYDLYVGVGVDPAVARCTADTLLSVTPEADLLALGIATGAPEAAALVEQAALACGVTPEQNDAAAAVGPGG